MSHNTYCYKCGGNCAWHCGNCNAQPTNTSNKTEVIPVAGASNYREWLTYYPELDPNTVPSSPWTEKYWLDNWDVFKGGSFTTLNRPLNVPIGFNGLDTTLGKPVWWNGTSWVDSTGTTV